MQLRRQLGRRRPSSSARPAGGWRQPVGVKAYLDGHEFDLDRLVDLLPSGDTRVAKAGDGYYLVAAEMDVRPADVPFYEVAARVLETVNGLARVSDPPYRPVKLSDRYEEGDRRHTVVLGTAEARLGWPRLIRMSPKRWCSWARYPG